MPLDAGDWTDRLPNIGADAVLVTRLPNVRYLPGFTGSNGQLLLSAEGGIVPDRRTLRGGSRGREVPGLPTEALFGRSSRGRFASEGVR